MERIVSGLAKINFQQNCEEILMENRMENMADRTPEMPGTSSYTYTEAKFNNCKEDSDLESDFNSSSETAIVGDDDADSSCSGSSTSCTSLSQRRNLPRRACKENSNLKLKRRSIMKPKRHTSRACDFSMLRPAEIKKIYCNQKLTCFRRTNLETIFEEPQPEGRRSETAIAKANTALRFIGLKKIKRSLSCSDGLNTNKTLIKQRRAKIKKIFGRRSVCKKISLSDFIDRLNKSFDDDADIEDAGLETDHDNNAAVVQDREEPMEAEMHMNVTSEADTSDVNESTEAAQNSSICGNSTTSSSSNKTEFAMILGTGMGNNSVHEYKNIENGSPFLLQNSFGTLGYSRDAMNAAMSGTAEKNNFLAGIH